MASPPSPIVPRAVSQALPLPRIEVSRAGFDNHIPLVQCVQEPTPYCRIPAQFQRLADQIMKHCPTPGMLRHLSAEELATLGLSAPNGTWGRSAPLGDKIKVATLLAAVARLTNEQRIEWSADLTRVASGQLSFTFIRGMLNNAFIAQGQGSLPTTVGVISHNHVDGTPEPNFPDLQMMARVRPVAKGFGLSPTNDEIIVVNLPGKDQFKLIRYEHLFRD